MIVIHATVLHTFLQKSRGLIGAKYPYPVYFTTRLGIHTFGVAFPIDVLILDRHYRVVKQVISLPPNKFFFWPIQFEKVVELPAGEIVKNKITIGSQLRIDPV